MDYVEILRCFNLDPLKVRWDSICQQYFDQIKVSAHRLNNLLPEKLHTEYNIRQG